MADQRPTPPAHRDVREQPVLDLVPLARARREVADGDLQARLVGEALEFHLPEPDPIPIAPPTVSTDQQPLRLGVQLLPHAEPPLADALDGEAGRVVINADVDPPPGPAHVVDPVGDRLADAGIGEVMDVALLRIALRLPFPAAVGVLPDQFLLLGVYRDDRLFLGEIPPADRVDVTELAIAVGVLLALQGLGHRLEAVAQVVEQLTDDAMADGEALPVQGLGQLAGTLAGPPQRGHRVAAGLGSDQGLQGIEDRRGLLANLLATAPRAADTTPGVGWGGEFLQRLLDRGVRESGGPADTPDAAVAQAAGLSGGEEPSLPLVEARQNRGELLFQGSIVVHADIMENGWRVLKVISFQAPTSAWRPLAVARGGSST